MSQVSYRTTYMGVPVEVVSGWDPPLQYYHFTVFDLRPDAEQEYFYSCLDEPDVFRTKNCDRWKQKAEQMHLQLPSGFWEKVELKLGNIIISYRDGKWHGLGLETKPLVIKIKKDQEK